VLGSRSTPAIAGWSTIRSSTQPGLRPRMPLLFRFLAPLVAVRYGKWFDAYKVNLFVAEP
jgi:hypothetical protein